MKTLITGGNRGLGLVLKEAFLADSLSRSNGYDITKSQDIDRIAQLSLDYDVFINNAFDGPAGAAWANFGQINTLARVFDLWREHDRTGYIINIGSVGEQATVPPVPDFERYRVTKSALRHASLQCTAAFKNHQVRFRTTLLTLDRLDTPLSRSRESWTGNGLACSDVVKTIEYIRSLQDNTCVGEIVTWVDFQHKQ